ncbi:MAG: MBL fold metallo-hydrolase, partial [Minisyncoccia bacterium]
CIDAFGEQDFDFEIKKVSVGDRVQISEFEVEFFNVDHGPNVSVPLAENFGLLIHVDGQSIYFAGDMYNPSGIDVTGLSVDYALLPVGGHYTFGPNEAFEFAKTFKSISKIIPMHYEQNNFVSPVRKDEFINFAKYIFEII